MAIKLTVSSPKFKNDLVIVPTDFSIPLPVGVDAVVTASSPVGTLDLEQITATLITGPFTIIDDAPVLSFPLEIVPILVPLVSEILRAVDFTVKLEVSSGTLGVSTRTPTPVTVITSGVQPLLQNPGPLGRLLGEAEKIL